MSDNKDEKTEEPTAKKLEKAMEDGQMAVSQEVKTWLMMLCLTGVMIFAAPYIAGQLTQVLAAHVKRVGEIASDESSMLDYISGIIANVGLLLAIPMGAFLIVGILSSRVQNPITFTPNKIAPDLSKLSPGKGFKKIFSANNVVEFIKSLVKMALAGGAVYLIVYPERDQLEVILFTPMPEVANIIYVMLIRVLVIVTILMTVIAAADHAWQVYQFHKNQRMTKQEVKDEHKQSDGDPKVKGRLRQIRRERYNKRLSAIIPESDVVVTNPTHFAVALKYKHGEMDVPVLTAKGVDSAAMRIRALAEDHDVPIVENPPLARALHATVDIDEEIPPDHYKAVAEVISYIMKLKRGPFTVQAPGAGR